MEDNPYIESLILRQLQQEASPAEQARLRQWLDAHPDNQQEYQALAGIWMDSPGVLNQSYDVDAAWEKIQSGLVGITEEGSLRDSSREEERISDRSLRDATVVPIRHVRGRKWLAAASVLLVVTMSAGWWYYRQHSQPSAQVLLAKNKDRRITLPDGSRVYLRKGGSLRYAEAMTGGDRSAELDGEAFFEVAHDRNRSFTVRTNHAIIEDIGTSFLVRAMDTTTVVIVSAGRVRLTDRGQTSRNITLDAGEKGILGSNGLSREKGDDRIYLAWRSGVLAFHNTPLLQALTDIREFYGVSITFAPGLAADSSKIRVTARFENQPLPEVLDEMKMITGLKCRQEKDTFVFYSK